MFGYLDLYPFEKYNLCCHVVMWSSGGNIIHQIIGGTITVSRLFWGKLIKPLH